MKYWLILSVALLFSFNAAAVIETYQFDNDVQRVRYHHFIEELRCPKCQNQNLSGSDSAISQDLRRQIHSMIMDDKSDIEITQYMVARYGDFILYRPRFNATTAILWLAPMGLLGIGLLVWWRMASRQNVIKSQPDSPLSIAEQAKLASLLKDDKQGEQP
jgi:cytochrome c-type biogenesis protein CcmH